MMMLGQSFSNEGAGEPYIIKERCTPSALVLQVLLRAA